MLFTASVALALGVAASASPMLAARQTDTTGLNVTSATYDGSCYYPTPDPDFPDLSEYLGKWYQLAGTPQIFELGCECIYAEYSLNDDGTVAVNNGCQLAGVLNNTIGGTAAAVSATYGAAGVFQVSFASVPGGGVICPGPNYIVQKYDGDAGYAIVQGPSFGSLFLLSRDQTPDEALIDEWLDEAYALGSNPSTTVKMLQTDCSA